MKTQSQSVLLGTRRPTLDERKRGAEIVFIRELNDVQYDILGCVLYESWEQWNAPTKILGDNVDDIQNWRDAL